MSELQEMTTVQGHTALEYTQTELANVWVRAQTVERVKQAADEAVSEVVEAAMAELRAEFPALFAAQEAAAAELADLCERAAVLEEQARTLVLERLFATGERPEKGSGFEIVTLMKPEYDEDDLWAFIRETGGQARGLVAEKLVTERPLLTWMKEWTVRTLTTNGPVWQILVDGRLVTVPVRIVPTLSTKVTKAAVISAVDQRRWEAGQSTDAPDF